MPGKMFPAKRKRPADSGGAGTTTYSLEPTQEMPPSFKNAKQKHKIKKAILDKTLSTPILSNWVGSSTYTHYKIIRRVRNAG